MFFFRLEKFRIVNILMFFYKLSIHFMYDFVMNLALHNQSENNFFYQISNYLKQTLILIIL